MFRIQKNTLLFFSFLLLAYVSEAQLSATGADKNGTTDFGDRYFIYCAPVQGASLGALTATSVLGSSTFAWEKYDNITNTFAPVGNQYTISGDTVKSTISRLDDGCYKVIITDSLGNSFEDQVWILHNWIEITQAEIPDSSSNCLEFKIWADFVYAPLIVYNTKTGESRSIRNSNAKFKFQWKQEDNVVSSALSPYIYELIASETPVKYDLTITDEFGCTGDGSVDYDSKVTKAEFTADPMDGEAVLEVNFTNSSINYDSTLWFFYKENFQYSLEVAAADGAKVDSIDFVLLDDSPKHEFENSGEYRVKLVTVKMNDTGNCRDTFHMDPGAFINVKESLLDVPNVFTPNGDGINDVFKIKSQSLKSMNVKIYNRWGGLVYSWKYSNITSKEYTYEHAVWDGRIGNRMAAPGVYYCVISYEGRDVWKDNPTTEEKKIRLQDRIGKPVKVTETKVLHLFRDKQ